MNEKILLALKAAEKTYIYNKNLNPENDGSKHPEHIIALNALYESFIYYGFAVSQIPEIVCELDEDSYLYESLIQPHLKVVDDIQMVAKQYALMYVKYIAKIAQGSQSQEAVATLFS